MSETFKYRFAVDEQLEQIYKMKMEYIAHREQLKADEKNRKLFDRNPYATCSFTPPMTMKEYEYWWDKIDRLRKGYDPINYHEFFP